MKLSKWQVFNNDEINQIHQASLEILEKTGILIESPRVRQILTDAGAICENNIIKFPRALVEDCVNKNQRTFPICDQNGNEVCVIGDGKVKFGAGHNAVFVLENFRGDRRNSLLKDVEDFAKICQQLEDIDIIGVPLNPSDPPDKTMLVHAVASIMKASTKPIFFSSESMEVNLAIIELAEAVTNRKYPDICGSYIISQLSTTSPLFWEKGASEALVECVRRGVPVAFLPQPIAGLTAPYTLAGNITVHNTEVLSGVVISHLVNPGTPLIYAAAWTSYDMRYSNVIIGRPEEALMRIGGAQMAHFYNMPSHCIGPDSDSNIYDEQMGFEKMMSLLAAVSGGNDLIVNSGMFGTGMTATNEQLLIDNEINSFAKRMSAGIEVNAESIAADLIKATGSRGTFLESDNTILNLRSGEHIEPLLVKGKSFEKWKNDGAQKISDVAQNMAQQILSTETPQVLTQNQKVKIEQVLKKWDNKYL